MTESSYFLGIEGPTQLRRDVLESAKDSVAILKERHKISELRAQRHDKVSQLKQTIADMHDKMQSLTKVLPSHSQRTMPQSLKAVEKRLKKKEEEESGEDYKKAQKPTGGSQEAGISLSEVAGIGPARIKKLNKIGIESAQQLADASASEITEKTDIVYGMAQNVIDAARERVAQTSTSSRKRQPLEQADQQSEEQESPDEMQRLESTLADIERKLNNL